MSQLNTQVIGYIYTVECLVNGKKYVGFTIQPDHRWQRHCRSAKNNSRFILHEAIRKYGPEQFQFNVICCCADKQYALKVLEPYFIQSLNTFYLTGYGYNMTLGGEGTFGTRVSRPLPEATKAKIRATMSTPEMRQKLSINGKRIKSAEERIKISKTLTGRKLSSNHIQHVKESQQGRKLSQEQIERMRNRIVSEATRAKLSAARKGQKASPEARANNSKAHTGYHHSEESKQKNRLSNLGKIISKETLAKLSEASSKPRSKKAQVANQEAQRNRFPVDINEVMRLFLAGNTRVVISKLMGVNRGRISGIIKENS